MDRLTTTSRFQVLLHVSLLTCCRNRENGMGNQTPSCKPPNLSSRPHAHVTYSQVSCTAVAFAYVASYHFQRVTHPHYKTYRRRVLSSKRELLLPFVKTAIPKGRQQQYDSSSCVHRAVLAAGGERDHRRVCLVLRIYFATFPPHVYTYPYTPPCPS